MTATASPAALFASADALLIDLDGTLVDSGTAVLRAWRAFAERHGLDVEHVHRFAQGRPAPETIRLLLPDADHAAEGAIQERLEVEDVAGVVALPGAERVLRLERPLAIVTSCTEPLALARLRAAGLPVPAVMVTAERLSRGKPDPECFLTGARLLGVEPERCVVLEDAPAGIDAGRAAGATVIGVRTGHDPAAVSGAHAVVDDLTALLR